MDLYEWLIKHVVKIEVRDFDDGLREIKKRAVRCPPSHRVPGAKLTPDQQARFETFTESVRFAFAAIINGGVQGVYGYNAADDLAILVPKSSVLHRGLVRSFGVVMDSQHMDILLNGGPNAPEPRYEDDDDDD